MAASIVRSDKEEEQWLNAALMVLQQAHRPMHYTNIKRLILEKGLVASGLKTTLEAALCKEKSHNQIPAGMEKKLPQLHLDKRAPLPITGERQHAAVVSTQQPTNGVSTEKTKPSGSANAIKKLVKPSLDPVAAVSLVNVVSHQKPVDEAAKYQEKYRKLKRFVKEMIFLNAAYCDEITRIEEKVIRVKEERRYLLRRLFQHQASTTPSSSTAPRSSTVSSQGAAYSSFGGSVPSQFSAVFQSISAAAPGAQSAANSSNARPSSQSIAQLLGEADKRRKKMTNKKRPLSEHGVKKVSGEITASSERTPSPLLSDGDNEPTASRVKKSRPSHAKQHVSPLPLDSTGRPILPIELGALTIYSLGEIVPKPGYHTTEHIYPVGFCSTRLFTAIAGHTPNCLYTCKVSDSGTAARFEISTEDVSDKTFVGSTPSECQRQLFEAIIASRGPGAVPLDSDVGADFFGLSHPTVQYLIQSCPKARSCANYQWTKFEVGRRSELPEVRVDDKASVAASILETMQGTPASLASCLLQQQHTEQLNIKVEPV